MPHQKHGKNNRHAGKQADTNNNVQHAPAVNNNGGGRPAGEGPVLHKCCIPGTCATPEDLIDESDVGTAVKVFCNNEHCTVGTWVHKSCFEEWEQSVLAYLRSCGRARSWSEKQRLQNLWTKKGYDLAFKACDCNCGRGHLRKDLDYVPPTPTVDNAPKKPKKKKTSTKPELKNSTSVGNNGRERHASNGNGNNNGNANVNANHHHHHVNPTTNGNGNVIHGNNVTTNGNDAATKRQTPTPSITIVNNNANRNVIRPRTVSVSSTGSSPPNSASPLTSGSGSPGPISETPPTGSLSNSTAKTKFDFSDQSGSTAASFFRKRKDLSAFNVLPKHKQNPYHIKMDDDCSTGNDDTRSFVLNHLSNYRVSALKCVLCKDEMAIFDRYPLVDGTLFLSPQAYDEQVIQVISDGRLQFINAVCVGCLEGNNDIRCAACKRKWDGSALLLGTMYSYDIFAAMPCCQKRLTCKHCRRAVVDVTSGLQYFSEYSHMIPCPYCKAYDYHFVRPLAETFAVKTSICK